DRLQTLVPLLANVRQQAPAQASQELYPDNGLRFIEIAPVNGEADEALTRRYVRIRRYPLVDGDLQLRLGRRDASALPAQEAQPARKLAGEPVERDLLRGTACDAARKGERMYMAEPVARLLQPATNGRVDGDPRDPAGSSSSSVPAPVSSRAWMPSGSVQLSGT